MGKFLCHYTWPLLHYLANWVSWFMATVSHFVLRLCINSISICWLTWRVAQFLCRNARGPKSSFSSRTTCCPFNLHSFYKSVDNILKFSSGKWPIALHQVRIHSDVMYLLSNLTTCFWTLKHTFVKVIIMQN